MTKSSLIQWGFAGTVFIGLGVVFALAFMNINTADNTLGIDIIFYAFEDWSIHYDVVNGLRNPPWSVLPLIPLGQLPLQAAWGIMVYVTIIISVFSVPVVRNKRLYVLAVILVVISFPSLRNIADANLEGLLVGGAVLTVAGYQRKNPVILALGVLFITIKPQACFVLLPVLALYVLLSWPPREWLKAAGIVLLFVIPTMLWRGEQWLAAIGGTYQAGSIIDISISAALERTGAVPDVVIWFVMGLILLVAGVISLRSQRILDREKAAMLMITSMLLAPYVAGNSVFTILAVGVIPLFLRSRRLGGLLIIMINLPFLFLGNRQILVDYQSYWWTFVLVTAWLIFNWRIYQREIAPTMHDDTRRDDAQEETSTVPAA
jgi:hypothetical protein